MGLAAQYGGAPAAPPANVDRDGEADADEDVVAGRVEQGGDDADDVPGAVDQRAAGAAGVDGRVHLDEALVALVGLRVDERALEAGDHADAERAVEAERVADDVRLAADPEGVGVAEDRGRHVGREGLDLEDGDVEAGVARHDDGAGGRGVEEGDVDLIGAVDDMERGEDLAALVDEHARAAAATLGPSRPRPKPGGRCPRSSRRRSG